MVLGAINFRIMNCGLSVEKLINLAATLKSLPPVQPWLHMIEANGIFWRWLHLGLSLGLLPALWGLSWDSWLLWRLGSPLQLLSQNLFLSSLGLLRPLPQNGN